MRRHTIRGFKYEEGSPMESLQEMEDKIEEGVLVEVVRCKDCHWWREKDKRCLRPAGGAFAVGVEYCSNGERRRWEH